MSEENVAVVMRGLEALNTGSVEMMVADADPGIRFVPRRAPMVGAYVGHDGMREYMADNEENLEVFQITPNEVIDAGDRVVVIGTLRVRGRSSGIDTTVPTATVTTVRDGKIVHFEEFIERDKALAAAGM
jgi:uncharacterized protein